MLAERNPSTDTMNAYSVNAAVAATRSDTGAGGGEGSISENAVSGAASASALAPGCGLIADGVTAAGVGMASGADAIDAALAWHGGDPRATIETLLADCGHLRVQLAAARNCISRGLTRGWLPELERPIAEL